MRAHRGLHSLPSGTFHLLARRKFSCNYSVIGKSQAGCLNTGHSYGSLEYTKRIIFKYTGEVKFDFLVLYVWYVSTVFNALKPKLV
jgi:hypothetical protein